MNAHTLFDDRTKQLWDRFCTTYKLSGKSQEQFLQYMQLLIDWNERMNLTTITKPASIIKYHFDDSLMLSKYVDLSAAQAVGDVGSGAGFPGLPLKIKYPHLHMVLIEVNHKRRQFLEHVIDTLNLENVELYPLDWRTFLRKTDYHLDYICARASLHPDELFRMFKPSSPYNAIPLVYWASIQWEPTDKEQPFIDRVENYKVGLKQRKLVFFKKLNNSSQG